MASLTASMSTGMKTFTEMPVGRQIAILGAIAGGIVAAAAILFWALKPTYAPLFNRIDEAGAAEVMQALNKMGVPYKVDNLSGRIEVPQQQIAETRLVLAGQGLPKSSDLGFEILQQEAGFGASRLIEGARYQRALEGELARSVSALEPVERARVHIAKAERSVFVRERTPPSASVVVHLRSGRSLNETQVGAIVHLISSSVPELTPERVTVVDQTGRLLTPGEAEKAAKLTLDNLDYTHRVEASFVDRVQSLLSPIVGRDGVRVQVAADLDFSRVERTEETYDPDRTAVRSEQSNEEERVGADPAIGGIPGALTNQPPQGGVAGNPGQQAAQANQATPSSRSQQTTRNYEVDRTIAHVQETPGGIRRLTTAVVVDFKTQTDADGNVTRVPRTDAELESIRSLVREAVGFSDKRGDSLSVSSASFVIDDTAEEKPPFWTEFWFLELVKIVGGLLMALIVLLTVVRPALKQLAPAPAESLRPSLAAAIAGGEGGDGEGAAKALTDQSGADGEGDVGEDKLALTHEQSALAALMGPKGPDRQQLDLDAVREMIKEDPKRVVQVMKSWLAEDGN